MEWNDDFCTLATLPLVITSTTPPENTVTKCLRIILGGPARNHENCQGRWHHVT